MQSDFATCKLGKKQSPIDIRGAKKGDLPAIGFNYGQSNAEVVNNGHLNKVWQAFNDGLEPGTELWSFRGRWKTGYRDYQMQGYVARLGAKIGPYFLTSQRSMRET
jgi:hypothetical protein